MPAMFKKFLLSVFFIIACPLCHAADYHFGDSITVGANASAPVNSYVSLLDAALGVSTVNYAVNGSAAADQVIVARAVVPSATDTVTAMLGVNDCQRYS